MLDFFKIHEVLLKAELDYMRKVSAKMMTVQSDNYGSNA